MHPLEVVLGRKAAFHDRVIPMDKYREYGVGSYEGPKLDKLAEQIGAKVGVCSTGDSFEDTPRDIEMMNKNEASVKEMESAAVAWVCEQFKLPYVPLKVATDYVDTKDDQVGSFIENLVKASAKISETIEKITEIVANKPLADFA